MSQELKQRAAQEAVMFIEDGMTVGVGTGSTVHFFIEELGKIKDRIEGAVASSIDTEKKLKQHDIPIIELNSAGEIPLYVDGADSFNIHKQLVKGGGGALTREKIIAGASKLFVCIVDNSKKADILGKFPIPVEVIPMARSFVAREILKLDGQPVYREGFTTDNGNIILDVHNWLIDEPIALEEKLNNIPGVVCNGLFALRGADEILIAGEKGVNKL